MGNSARNDRTGKTVKILLVDDSEVMLRHVSLLLQQAGYEVKTASNLQMALQTQSRFAPQAVLSDFVLEAGVTGLVVLSAIFSLFPTGTPGRPAGAILTLGKLSDADERTATSMGVPVLQKPVRGKEHDFLQNIEFWLHSAGVI